MTWQFRVSCPYCQIATLPSLPDCRDLSCTNYLGDRDPQTATGPPLTANEEDSIDERAQNARSFKESILTGRLKY